MNKSDFIDQVAIDTGLTKKDCSAVLDSVLSNIKKSVCDGDGVSFVGFGAFTMKHRSARKGRNPQTGAELEIKAANAPSFKVGKLFKEEANA
jgi:DNA-binding protein HU-beta